MFGHKKIFLQFSWLIFKWETKFRERLNPWSLLWPHKGKTLKSWLLKKLSLEFFETQDLSSTYGKPKLLFYDYSWNFFFLQPIAEGNCAVLRSFDLSNLFVFDSHCLLLDFFGTSVKKTFLQMMSSLQVFFLIFFQKWVHSLSYSAKIFHFTCEQNLT